MLFRCLKSCDPTYLLTAYKSYILPILEYNSTVWFPHLLKDIDNIESVQRNFIWHLFKRCGLPNMPYNDRLASMVSITIFGIETHSQKLNYVL